MIVSLLKELKDKEVKLSFPYGFVTGKLNQIGDDSYSIIEAEKKSSVAVMFSVTDVHTVYKTEFNPTINLK